MASARVAERVLVSKAGLARPPFGLGGRVERTLGKTGELAHARRIAHLVPRGSLHESLPAAKHPPVNRTTLPICKPRGLGQHPAFL